MICFSALHSYAQSYDTTYYIKYKNNLSLGTFFSVRNYTIDISQDFTPDSNSISNVKWKNNAATSMGFTFDYDKITFGFSFKLPAGDEERLGKTKFRNYGLAIGGNKFFIDAGYRYYKGFYDQNSPNYLSEFNDSTPYYHDNSMQVKAFRGKMLYFFNNKKYSFRSAWSASQRQLKSAISPLVYGNFHWEEIKSDTSIIPFQLRSFYNHEAGLNNLHWFAATAGGGASTNLVIAKRFFFHLTAALGIETQWRTSEYFDGHSDKDTYVSFSGDLRAGIGYNSKRFIISFIAVRDFHFINNSHLIIKEEYYSGLFLIAYRFNVNEPGFYKRFRESDIYNKF